MRPNDGPKSGSSTGSRDNSRDNSKGSQKPRSPAGERRLGDFLCFAIYSANLAFGRAYKKGLDELGLTYPQWIAIVALWEQDGQTVSELGDKMFLESNTLTPILKKLEQMGYLRRQRDPADERQVRINLTEAGRRLREKGMHMNLVASTGLKPDEFVRLQENVVTLRDNLIKATAEEA
ncbi:MarR family winged helix-turn-helix transcriptional regulator [Bradyrhizobium valentinum]|uniref:MarR family winged helix-turn-helix transcriptional regulator n=1 Tax=Bradyrhizobium valentinum TaxID=1518501 RepID=UPI0009E93C15|nr:MarR family transcriptional regulator [Bradyrhizobium valentinum]